MAVIIILMFCFGIARFDSIRIVFVDIGKIRMNIVPVLSLLIINAIPDIYLMIQRKRRSGADSKSQKGQTSQSGDDSKPLKK